MLTLTCLGLYCHACYAALQEERTPLWWASRNGHVAIVRLLLAAGASREAEDKVGGRGQGASARARAKGDRSRGDKEGHRPPSLHRRGCRDYSLTPCCCYILPVTSAV